MSEPLSKRALTKKENVPDRFDPEGTPTWTMSRGQVAIEIAALEATLEDAGERLERAGYEHKNLEEKLRAMEHVAKFLVGIDSDTPDTDWQVMFKIAQGGARIALAAQQEKTI